MTWYAAGLRFDCHGCGRCCRGHADWESYVWLTVAEGDAIAAFLGTDRETFFRRYVRRVEQRFALLDKSNGDCIFWKDGAGCTVYEARPSQCRTFPFWPETLTDKAAWDEVCEFCPGAGEGRLYTPEEVAAIARGGSDTSPGSPRTCSRCPS